MKTTVLFSLGVRALCAAALMLAAAASVAAAEHPCSVVSNPADRLACYDKAFGAPATPANSAAAAPDFGLPPAKPAREAAQAKKEELISAAVTGVERRRDGKLVVTLDNDQTWQQAENNSQVDVRVGDTITVRRAALGSYLLVSKAGVGTRVKRLR